MKIILDKMSLTEAGIIAYERSIEVFIKYAPMIDERLNKYKRILIRRGNVKTYFKPLTIKSVDITFHLIPNCLGKTDFNKYGLRVLVAGEFRLNGDRYYSLLLNGTSKEFSQIAIYTTHFLERYVERHLGDDSPINIETFIKFLKETDAISCGFQEGNSDNIQWTTSIGNICGCVLHPRVLLSKTYIDNSTIIRGKKKEANEKGNELTKYFTTNKIGFRTIPKSMSKNYNFTLKK